MLNRSPGFYSRICTTLAAKFYLCSDAPCQKLKDIKNGVISYVPDNKGEKVDHGTVAIYTKSCNKGYMLVGSEQRTCQNGMFSGSEPVCVKICKLFDTIINSFFILLFYLTVVCDDLSPLENGKIVYNSEESPRLLGTVATHICNQGFILVGGVNRTCEESTEFSGSPPTCCERKCGQLNPK